MRKTLADWLDDGRVGERRTWRSRLQRKWLREAQGHVPIIQH
jgi:hypothetical protein